MNGATLKTMVESIMDDTIDDVLFYQLLNVAKNRIENERPWMFLRKLDSSLTTTVGDNSSISRALPTDWRRTYKLMVGLDQQFIQVPFDEQHQYRYSSNRFVIDVAGNVYYLLGTLGKADTIYHYYIKKTDDITAVTSPVWNEFHEILAFDTAGYAMMGTDADDIYARMSPENKNMALMLKNSMEAWDFQLQIDAQGGSLSMGQNSYGIDLGLM
jgi:uncharacterized membrane-anchored protein YjiN (DUF445 family)